MWMMVKEGGWGALFALGVGSLGAGVGILALAMLAISRKGAHAMGLLTLVFAFLAPMLGVLGMASGRHKVDAVLGMVEGRGMQARIRHQGYLEAQSSARVGAYFAILPLLLGATAALLGARKKPEDPPGNGRWIAAGVVGGFSFLMMGGAFAASQARLPPDMPRETAELLDARDRVDTNISQGCADFEHTLETEYWHTSDRTQWPRHFEPDPRTVVPDFDATATRCARQLFDDAKAGHAFAQTGGAIRVQDILASPLLVDEGLRKEIQDRIRLENDWGPGGHDIGDSLFRPGTVKGGAPIVRPGAVAVMGRLPPEVIQRIVRTNNGRFRTCYTTALEKNPTLAGKVTVKFVIDQKGSVSSASDGGSDIGDPDMVKCVVRAFDSMSFPEPEGGIVTVTYPMVFTAGT